MADRPTTNVPNRDSSGYPSAAASASPEPFPFPIPLPFFPFNQSPIQQQPLERPSSDFENRCLSCGNVLPPGGNDISCEFCLTASEGFANSFEHDIPGASHSGIIDPRSLKKLPEPPQARAKLPSIPEGANRVRLAAAAPGTRDAATHSVREPTQEHHDDRDREDVKGSRPTGKDLTPRKRSLFEYVGIAALALTLVLLLRRWRR
ncbi:hypothetical protein GUITHDRAFT_118705 [Guillardia theta CCMP2712]|uniref:Uncharacterized protein n=2 Tax=Guillardia theta TaxID=55529 RepID=L1IGD2_GUITC|nr:hypothetical protein GUITHDRAFT_118705 [Guillardia theta CCMP2712]EKX35157.1 hypothetical protein GUITHDRAFT_118705 [Guillardia theta CCMP2712]|mmetsp:Transcript_49630/g.155382  ORF Transcript_49630/g.155382 Transcript_49630/m.155382 type:complete len:205 (+) Transcript_49630:121-735(+)|eukprot:XP_005822137.1 hypothetical protein GUITHDRAFT_118705 [Guillardia theta CCMP2712]